MSSSTIEAEAVTDRELEDRFHPIFDRIAEGALGREQDRRLPFDEVGLLRDARFGALRVPSSSAGSARRSDSCSVC